MNLLVSELGHVELAEAVRFTEEWERDASLRLRRREAAVLAEYDDQGRIRGNDPAEAMEDARRLYVARYLQGDDVELIIYSNELAGEMGRRIRDDLQHLGIVSRGSEVQVAGGSAASTGDVIIARTNDHRAGVANSDVLRVEAVNDDGTITVRRRVDRDGATGKVAWASDTFRYGGYATANLAYGATAHTKQAAARHLHSRAQAQESSAGPRQASAARPGRGNRDRPVDRDRLGVHDPLRNASRAAELQPELRLPHRQGWRAADHRPRHGPTAVLHCCTGLQEWGAGPAASL
jgi:hypothetical protein